MNEQQNTQKIIEIYEAFGRGDLDAIINATTEDVVWLSQCDPIVPWSGDFSGKANVKGFFDAIYTSVEVLGFEPQEFVAQGDTVVSMGTFESKSYKTDKSANTKWIFVWKLRDGQVCSYEQFHDASLTEIFAGQQEDPLEEIFNRAKN